MRLIAIWILCSLALIFFGCGEEALVEMQSEPEVEQTTRTSDLFSDNEWAVVESLSPLPNKPPPSPTNRVADNPDAAQLGQMFFFDARFSKEGTISCATCHSPFHGFADVEATSLGNRRGTRNAPTVLNAAYNEWQFWDGRADTLWAQALFALEGEDEQAGTRLQYAHLVYQHYQANYEAIFGPLPELEDAMRFPSDGKPGDPTFDDMSEADRIAVNTVFANIGKAIEAYERLLISRNAPFDRYVAGDEEAITLEAKRGLKVFIGKGVCVLCHGTPYFRDNDFHNIGIPQDGLPEDTGRFQGVAKLLADPFNSAGIYSDSRADAAQMLNLLEPRLEHQGEFKTPTLRNVALTAPYFHTGEFPTLASVIEFNNVGGTTNEFIGRSAVRVEPLHLTEQEKQDLVSFLETLTGEPPPAHLLIKPKLP